MRNQKVYELRDELLSYGHLPMALFVERLSEEPWAKDLTCELSMLRLWIRGTDAESVELIVTYDDGREGGRPTPPWVDSFVLSYVKDMAVCRATVQNQQQTLECVRAWVERTSEMRPDPQRAGEEPRDVGECIKGEKGDNFDEDT